MGVYIKDMEMPTERESFNLTIKYNGTVLDTETGIQVAEAYELPSHGDLIDKDETMNAILEQRGEDTACWFAGIVNDMPAIVPSDNAEDGE